MFEKILFGQKIYKLRSEKNVTQQVLANALNLKKTTISMIENGERAPSIEVLYALADYFEVSIDYLVGRTDAKQINKN